MTPEAFAILGFGVGTLSAATGLAFFLWRVLGRMEDRLRSEMRGIRGEVKASENRLRHEMEASEGRLRGGVGELRGEVRELARAHGEVAREVSELRGEVRAGAPRRAAETPRPLLPAVAAPPR